MQAEQQIDIATVPVTRSYEELCEAGRMARTEGDRANWIIGDLACEIETEYSEHTLADFAREIGKPRGTIYECRQMSGFWEPSERAEIEAEYPNITRSHMRKCLPLRSIDLARFALDKCSTKGWTVDQFGYILKRYRHMKGITPRPTKRDDANRVEFEAHWWDGDWDVNLKDGETICQLKRDHPDATVVITVTWTAAP